MRKKLSVTCMVIAIAFIILGFVSPFIIKKYIVVDELKLNEITTWVTGGMSTCFSLSSICLVILNINISGDNERRNQFQYRFFKLYDIFDSARKRLPDCYFENITTELDEKLSEIDYTVIASDSLRDIMYDTCRCYDTILKKEKNYMQEYMSCLFQLMLFVDTEDIDKSEKQFCMNFFSAGLSNIEKKLIFYHSMNNSDGKQFHDIIEKYSVLWNLDKDSIINQEMIMSLYQKKLY